MSYFAAVASRGPDGWSAAELDLTGAADVEEVADRMREADPEATGSVLFVEADDAYLAIVRVDEAGDIRVFGSDSAFAEESRIGALLLGDLEAPALEIEEVAAPAGDGEDTGDGDHGPVGDPDADPVGDADLLADLGVSAHRLLKLCGEEGMMPADVTAEIGQIIGCGDEIEELREA
ncbi:tRNA adenosine deaminase-associated protein [Rhizomonospora bruguierae]|uniref:tRNA adenosine deaminase-associated protein n=1 Tax=Rhizomonospora bruguierae TaxID=1581705 RepID=UPI001BCFBBF6|nr:tRNA adenosine deaminase-associated protein [Micromonospora sp. NBRC 107566]